MKGLGLVFIAVCIFTFVSCNREETTNENALTRSVSVNDSTEDKGRVSITVDTVWNGETHIGF